MLNKLKIILLLFLRVSINVTLIYGNHVDRTHRSPKLANIFNRYDGNAFEEIYELTNKYNPLSLDYISSQSHSPQHVLEALRHVVTGGGPHVHQYTDFKGDPQLRTVLANFYSILMNRKIDLTREVLVTASASHGLYLTAKAYLNPGDEVIIFEPFYVMFKTIVELTGGVPVFVPLRTAMSNWAYEAQELTFDRGELDSKFTNRTKMIWVNNPNNPTGKLFTEEELLFIGQLCEKYDVLIISDEVAQFMSYEPIRHLKIASLPGLWKRTLTVNSGGKMLTTDGWRVGWVIGPKDLLWPLIVESINSILSAPTALQMTFATALDVETHRLNTIESYFHRYSQELVPKRDRIVRILNETGIWATKPSSGYFILANFSSKIMDKNIDLSSENEQKFGYRLTYWLLKHKNLLLMPGNPFYSNDSKYMSEYLMRICFIQSDDTIDQFEMIIKNTFN